MPQDDTYQWVRTSKLTATAGVIALCLFAGAFFLNGDPRWFCWSASAGLVFSAALALAGAYMRRGPADTSRAAIEARTRFTRVSTAAAVTFGGVSASIVSIFENHYAYLFGFVTGFFTFGLLLFSPLFAPKFVPQQPASPLSRMTSMERAARRNYQ
jgi:hypothetical protein